MVATVRPRSGGWCRSPASRWTTWSRLAVAKAGGELPVQLTAPTRIHRPAVAPRPEPGHPGPMPDPLPDRPPGAVPLDRETLIARFDVIRQFRQGGRRAPNKPLLLLYALSRRAARVRGLTSGSLRGACDEKQVMHNGNPMRSSALPVLALVNVGETDA